LNKAGFSLIELVMVIIILGIAIPTSIYVLGALTERSVEAEAMTVATNLAQRLIEEIRSKRFDENDPPEWTPYNLLGQDDGEDPGNKLTFDDVDDFDGWSQNPIPDFDKFNSEVCIFYVRGTDLDAEASFVEGEASYTGYKRVEVVISVADGGSVSLATLVGGY